MNAMQYDSRLMFNPWNQSLDQLYRATEHAHLLALHVTEASPIGHKTSEFRQRDDKRSAFRDCLSRLSLAFLQNNLLIPVEFHEWLLDGDNWSRHTAMFIILRGSNGQNEHHCGCWPLGNRFIHRKWGRKSNITVNYESHWTVWCIWFL
jgi:hypothetical protein